MKTQPLDQAHMQDSLPNQLRIQVKLNDQESTTMQPTFRRMQPNSSVKLLRKHQSPSSSNEMRLSSTIKKILIRLFIIFFFRC